MLCPYCGKEMTDGAFIGPQASGFYWVPAERRPKNFLFTVSERSVVEKYDGLWFQKPLSSDTHYAYQNLSICKNCRKGVVDIAPEVFESNPNWG